jgi:hypothetical protein
MYASTDLKIPKITHSLRRRSNNILRRVLHENIVGSSHHAQHSRTCAALGKDDEKTHHLRGNPYG